MGGHSQSCPSLRWVGVDGERKYLEAQLVCTVDMVLFEYLRSVLRSPTPPVRWI